jgi:enoyl-CoA hydratase
MADTHQGFALERVAGIARLRFTRPETRNSLSIAVCTQLRAVLNDLADDHQCRALVIEGSGGSFASGADIAEINLLRSDPPKLREMYRNLRATQERLYTLPHPTIALIDGYCMGAGLSLALACDLRVATVTSVFGAPPARIGLLYSKKEISRMLARIGAGRTREMLFTGRTVQGDEALQVGLIEKLSTTEQLEADCRDLLGQLGASSLTSIRQSKQQLLQLEQSASAAIDDETDAEEAFFSPDAAEGLRAFIERRTPRFRNF